MSYDALRASDTVRVHRHAAEEVLERLRETEQVARRHLADAETVGLSSDARHNLAYSAGRVAAEMVMVAEGFQAGRRMGKHAAVFAFLTVAAGNRWSAEADYFDKRRQRRNASEYEQAGTISPTEAETITPTARPFLEEVLAWLHESHRLPAGEAGV